MSRFDDLKRKLKNREPVLSTTIANVAWSGLAQKIAAYSFDFVVLDEEHGTLSAESGEEILRVCRLCDLPAIVRVGNAVPNIIAKTLDMGADGIMIPRVETIEQIEIAVNSARYYPRGRKGCGGFSNFRKEDQGSVEIFNNNRFLMPQIESYEGLRVLPRILDEYRDEIACILIGPYDSSIMVGTPLDIMSEAMRNFDKEVFDLCKAAGMSTGIFVDNASLLPYYRELGANVFWTGTEISLLCEAFGSLCDAFKREFE